MDTQTHALGQEGQHELLGAPGFRMDQLRGRLRRYVEDKSRSKAAGVHLPWAGSQESLCLLQDIARIQQEGARLCMSLATLMVAAAAAVGYAGG